MAEFPIIPSKTGMIFFDILNIYLHPEDPEQAAAVEASGVVADTAIGDPRRRGLERSRGAARRFARSPVCRRSRVRGATSAAARSKCRYGNFR